MFATVSQVASSAEADLMISLLRAEGYHPLDLDMSSHFSLAGCETGYQVVVPREEEGAALELLRDKDHEPDANALAQKHAARVCTSANERLRKCSKCGATMEEGFLLDRVDDNRTPQPAVWVAGMPEISYFSGGKTAGKNQLQIRCFRCCECGLLESYASESFQ
jgi:hypothetical protein